MKQSLFWRFAIIFIAIGLSIGSIYMFSLRYGIDLQGGTSLLYELDLSKYEGSGDTADLAQRVVNVLKLRVDPLQQKNLIWRVIGNKRIQIQMPLADAKTRDAREKFNATLEDLRKSSLRQSEILSAVARPAGPDRDAAITELAPLGTPRHDLLVKLADAHAARESALTEAKKFPSAMAYPDDLIKTLAHTKGTYETAQSAVTASNVDVAKLQSLLVATENENNKPAAEELAKFPQQYASQRALIERVIEAHKNFRKTAGFGLDDPADLQRMVTAAGVLDFRIAVTEKDLGGYSEAYVAALQSLEANGPRRAIQNMAWFEVDPSGVDSLTRGGYITSIWAAQPYILLYTDLAHSLTHDPDRRDWKLADARTSSDQGKLAVSFKFDQSGGSLFGELTANNVSRPMAILLDNRAISAPNIMGPILTGDGQITFGSVTPTRSADQIRREAENLVKILEAGSLPATLQKEPISVQVITPELGHDNITAGFNSSIYALIAVAIFMLLYYTITGAFANIAVVINLIMILGAMAFLGGTFTLPGIAGLVLTLGMAVDANVLINERIREEIHKGASLAMAVRLGYDKVFWTIFDANLTTSLTSMVLIAYGSEEVKGFGVTLLIGLIVHMFTALFVTRTFMYAGIKWGLIKHIDDHSIAEYFREIVTLTWLRNGHWPFMRVITVSNIDWIGKRYYFWAFSTLITLAGIVAFFARGDEKYDTEFRGGTQVTFKLSPHATLTLDQVRERIQKIPFLPDLTPAERTLLKDVEQSRVYGIGTDGRKWEMQTSIADDEAKGIKIRTRFLELLARQFSDVLQVKPQVTIFDHKFTAQNSASELLGAYVIVPITFGTLDQVFEGTPITGIPNRDVTNFINGTAVLLENMNPPQTAEQLTDRIRTTRQSGSLKDVPYREFRVIPITALENAATAPANTAPAAATAAATSPAKIGVPAKEDDTRPLTRAVVVSVDSSIPATAANWPERVAATEWQIVTTALQSADPFDGVTSFDAVVAGQAKIQALVSIIVSLVLIVIYVWIRFGGILYGIGAILSLLHDASVALAATVLSGVIYHKVFGGHANFLLISDFKINLTMIAAYLTIIGYSVNDTIVIFDRVRELRGRSTNPISAKLLNDAINQCFGRTIWTTFTVFITVLILYIWGGEATRGFAFAMLIGVITGAYSTLAIASPALLSLKIKRSYDSDSPNPFLITPTTDLTKT